MKIKLCPQCGKQNDVNAWNCVECGATLSLNTIVDAGDFPSSQVVVAGKGVLSSVSPFFQDDLAELIKTKTRSSESIVKGCDVCKPSVLPPYKFGFIIITSEQILCVFFDSEIKANLLKAVLPKRPWSRRVLGSFVEGSSVEPPLTRLADHRFVNRPDYALTSAERSSRKIISYSLDALYSCELVNDIFLNLKFRSGDGISLVDFSVTFYFNDEAYAIYKALTEKT